MTRTSIDQWMHSDRWSPSALCIRVYHGFLRQEETEQPLYGRQAPRPPAGVCAVAA